jgi:RimJ/RimL family protein N-acetyltransferase
VKRAGSQTQGVPLPVSTARCLLRPAVLADFDALAAAVGSPDFPYDLPLADLQRRGKLQAWYEALLTMCAEGRARVFSVDLRREVSDALDEGARCIGQVSLVPRDVPGSWNLAYWLHPSRWGAGLAVEVARAAIDHAFTAMPVDEIWAGAAPWNRRSIRTLDKLGLQPVERAPDPKVASTAPSDLHICAISRERWLHDYAGE